VVQSGCVVREVCIQYDVVLCDFGGRWMEVLLLQGIRYKFIAY
jgi:hypothetical protein